MTKILFVTQPRQFASSTNTLAMYIQSANALGHEAAVFGKKNWEFPRLKYSLDVDRFDYAVFVINESTDFPDLPHLAWILDAIPKERRIVIDCCGRYGDTICADRDVNHLEQLDGHAGWEWIESFQTTAGAILQPTLAPLRTDARRFLFHGYNAMWEQPLQTKAKPYGIVYVGGNWFRWPALRRVLDAVGPVRSAVGRMIIAGEGWQ